MKFSIAALALVAGIAAAPSALSHLDSTAFNQSYRQSLFALLGANFGPMTSMVKGEMPWDQARFIGWSDDLAEVAQLDIMRGFPAAAALAAPAPNQRSGITWRILKPKLQTCARRLN